MDIRETRIDENQIRFDVLNEYNPETVDGVYYAEYEGYLQWQVLTEDGDELGATTFNGMRNLIKIEEEHRNSLKAEDYYRAIS